MKSNKTFLKEDYEDNKKTILNFADNNTYNYKEDNKTKSKKIGLNNMQYANKDTNKILDILKRQNSFFEDDPNYLYDYLNKANLKNFNVEADADNRKKFNKITRLEDITNMNLDYFNKPKFNNDLVDYKENLTNVIVLKNKLKNNAFLLRQESKNTNELKKLENKQKNENNINEDNKNRIIKIDEEDGKEDNFLKMRLKNEKVLYGIQNFKQTE